MDRSKDSSKLFTCRELGRVKACPPRLYHQHCVPSHGPSFQMIPQQKTGLWSCCFPHRHSETSSTALALGCHCLRHPRPWFWPPPAGICCCGRRGRWGPAGTRLWGWASCGSIEPMCNVHTSGAHTLGPRWCRLGRSRCSRAPCHLPAGHFISWIKSNCSNQLVYFSIM